MYHKSTEGQSENLDLYRERLKKFSQDFEFGLFIHLALKSVIWIILFITLAGVGGFLYIRYTPPQYESASILQIRESNKASKLLELDIGGGGNSDEMMSDLEVIRSKEFLKIIFGKLPINISYYNEGQILNYELYKSSPYRIEYEVIDVEAYQHKYYVYFPNKNEVQFSVDAPISDGNYKTYKIGEEIIFPFASFKVKIIDFDIISNDQNGEAQNNFFFILNSSSNILNTYNKKLVIKILSEASKSLSITFSDGNPRKAADLANAIANGFINYDLDRKIHSTTQIIDFIDNQISEVYNKLKSSEVSIQEFKLTNKITGSEEVTGIYLDRLGNLEEELIKLELEQEILTEVKGAATGNSDSIEVHELIPLLAGTQFEDNIMQQIAYLQEIQIEKEQSLYEVTKSSGRVQNLDYQVRIQKKLLIESIFSMEAKLKNRISSIQGKVNEIEQTFTGLPLQELKYSRLKRIFTINEKFYTLLLEKKAEYAIAKAGIVPESVILERAVPNYQSIAPKKGLTYIAFFLCALVLSISLVIIRYLSYNHIGSLNDIIKLTNASITTLGIVPRIKENIPVSQLIVDKRPKSVLAESFRSLRTNLQFLNRDNIPGPKIISTTSTISGEGKTFVTINLGGIIAFSGKKVIILDLDMRKPKIHKGFNVDNKNGMSTLLIGKDKVEDTIHHSEQDNLDFITAGPVPPNPSELIINGKLLEVIEELKQTYDIILIDNPPVGLVTDGIYCLKLADYPLYVFRAEYSKRNFAQMVDRVVNENNIKNLAVILNGVEIQSGRYSYNYSYGYGYGYGYGYSYGNGGYYDEPEDNKK